MSRIVYLVGRNWGKYRASFDWMGVIATNDPAPWDVVIAGAGMAGLSTAIWARRLGLSAVVLEGREHAGGQLAQITQTIIDYPGLANTGGPSLAASLRRQAEELGAVLRLGEPVLAVDAEARLCRTARGDVQGRALVLATGLTPRRLGVPGEVELDRAALVRRPSAERDWFEGRRVAIIGGGDRAVENALLLAPAATLVWVIHRGGALRARAPLQGQLAPFRNIGVKLDTRVTSFDVNGDSATLALDPPASLTVDAVCIYIGNESNTQLVRGQLALTDDERVVTDANGQTALPLVYAVGDVATEPVYHSLATAAGHAMVVAKHIALALENLPA